MKLLAVFEAILVVALWSTSPPLVKIAMQNLSPLQLVGVRYFGGFIFLLPFLIWNSRQVLRSISVGAWMRLGLMGILGYVIGNGFFFYSLSSLPATTSSFLLSSIPIFTLVAGIFWLNERPSKLQGWGFLLALAGGVIYFGMQIEAGDVLAMGAGLLGALALSLFGLMARDFVRKGEVNSTVLTAVPMCIGGGLLLIITPVREVPPMPVIWTIAWLAIINSALAYMIWNHALKRLKAFEISIVASLMPMGTAIIAPLLLVEEVVSPRAWLGMGIGVVGVMLVGIAGDRPTAVVAEGMDASAGE